jgi:hypothetical protein
MNEIHKLAQMLYAMNKNQKERPFVRSYPRTWTDERPFIKKSRGRASVPADVREGWELLALKGEK